VCAAYEFWGFVCLPWLLLTMILTFFLCVFITPQQEFQWENCESELEDPMWLAKLSEDCSRDCVVAALLAAAEDARVAKEFLASS
jgi:hypothetical protein